MRLPQRYRRPWTKASAPRAGPKSRVEPLVFSLNPCRKWASQRPMPYMGRGLEESEVGRAGLTAGEGSLATAE